jgi:hypothetical protein
MKDWQEYIGKVEQVAKAYEHYQEDLSGPHPAVLCSDWELTSIMGIPVIFCALVPEDTFYVADLGEIERWLAMGRIEAYWAQDKFRVEIRFPKHL